MEHRYELSWQIFLARFRPWQGHLDEKVNHKEKNMYLARADSQSARELVYRSLEAADHAEVKRQALIT